ncbi:hypothetical protein PCASD_13912 [Puccinia coronata f. sp. avenae]|uniref:Uncharacterized protein n=1 Tax=Puccinia coronata f. sp. avenae TaxID=200324 RepID=A0A2N5U4X4_9BASI|nr:hypothetical protein PCASD_13912 [Puccinia coronata f. sp. avenae]
MPNLSHPTPNFCPALRTSTFLTLPCTLQQQQQKPLSSHSKVASGNNDIAPKNFSASLFLHQPPPVSTPPPPLPQSPRAPTWPPSTKKQHSIVADLVSLFPQPHPCLPCQVKKFSGVDSEVA